MSETDREVLFANEAFVIGMLQAVSGGSIVAAISQIDNLVKSGGRTALLLFLTATAVSLTFAVLAAYWKHQYKLWDIKGGVSRAKAKKLREEDKVQEAESKENEARERGKKSERFLSAMRSCMATSVIALLLGIGQLVIAFWMYPSQQQAPNEVLKENKPNVSLGTSASAISQS